LIKQLSGIFSGACLFVAVYGLPPFTGGPNTDYLNGDAIAAFKTENHRQANGIYEVSVLTSMPGVTPEMVRWWFADYMQTTEHYKRWHPDANKVPGEYVGAAYKTHDYISENLTKLRIQFVPPEGVLGETRFRADDVAICARTGLLDKPLYTGTMCHIIRNTDSGAEMLSRVWLGQISEREDSEAASAIGTMLGNTFLARSIGIAKIDAENLMTHMTEEMRILAEFLPELYAAEASQIPE